MSKSTVCYSDSHDFNTFGFYSSTVFENKFDRLFSVALCLTFKLT